MTRSAVVRRMKVAAVPHGFRSTFRDWASERTNYPRNVAEMALAYAIGDKVEAACRRGDLFEKRRRLMADWAAFCGRVQPKGGVVSIRQNRTSSPRVRMTSSSPARRNNTIQTPSSTF
jgi:hypothetical protein